MGEQYMQFQVVHKFRDIGYVLFERDKDHVVWRAFHPLQRKEHDKEFARHGIGTLVHATVVDYLARTLPINVSLRHEPNQHTSPSRKMHLAAMGFDVSTLNHAPLVVALPHYHERSLAYAHARGFSPQTWTSVQDKRYAA
jgi:hypothetical protein